MGYLVLSLEVATVMEVVIKVISISLWDLCFKLQWVLVWVWQWDLPVAAVVGVHLQDYLDLVLHSDLGCL